jgi:hypothetical protein
MSGEINYKLRDEFDSFISLRNFNDFSPNEFEDRIRKYKTELRFEIEKNICNPTFHNEFIVLNYLNNLINFFDSKSIKGIPNIEDIVFIFNFIDDYNNCEPYSFCIECFFSNEKTKIPEIIEFRRLYYYNRINYCIHELILELLRLKK